MLYLINHLTPDEAESLYRLQRAAYQVESELIDYPNLPPLRESLAKFQQSGEEWLVWQEAEVFIGGLAFVIQHETIDICRLVISPAHFRRGLARQLLQALESIALNALKITVSTAARNHPAINLYQSQGYQIIRHTNTPDGLTLVHLEKMLISP